MEQMHSRDAHQGLYFEFQANDIWLILTLEPSDSHGTRGTASSLHGKAATIQLNGVWKHRLNIRSVCEDEGSSLPVWNGPVTMDSSCSC